MDVRELVHKIGFAVDFGAYDRANDKFNQVNKTVDTAVSKLEGYFTKMEAFGKKMSMAFTLPITGIATVSVAARVNQEALETKWGVLLGSMKRGIEFNRQLRELSEHTHFTPEAIDQYAASLKRLQVPVGQIIPMIKKFSDIGAGTGQNAGEMMDEYAQARLNPIMRGMMLRRLMLQGAISQADIQKAGLEPRRLRQEGAMGMIGMSTFDAVFNAMYARNAGKSQALADQLGKNLERFWFGITRIREEIGKVIEKTLHLNTFLKAGAEVFSAWADKIEHMPAGLQRVLVLGGALVAIVGPAVLMFAKIGSMIMGISKALVLLSFNPMTLEIMAVIVALTAVFLLIYKIKRMMDRSKEIGDYNALPAEKRQSMEAFNAQGTPTGGWEGFKGKGAYSVSLPAGAGLQTAPNIHISNTIHLEAGGPVGHIENMKAAMDEQPRHAAKHIVKSINNARRGPAINFNLVQQ